MGVSPDHGKSSTRHAKLVDERFPSQMHRRLMFQDKYVKSSDSPALGSHHGISQRVDSKSSPRPISSGNSQTCSTCSKASKDGELIKHMSNLPSYLQGIDKEENLQGKALNFGVLNWECLKKWKHDQKGIQVSGSTNASSRGSKYSMLQGQSTGSSAVYVETHTHERKQHSSVKSNSRPSHKADLFKGQALPISEHPSQGASNVQKKFPNLNKDSDISFPKGKVKEVVSKIENVSSSSISNGVSTGSKEKVRALVGDVEKRVVRLQRSEIRSKSSDNMNYSELPMSLPILRTIDGSFHCPETRRKKGDKTKKESEKDQVPNMNLTHRFWPNECESIVVQQSGDVSMSTSTGAYQFTEPRAPIDECSSVPNYASFSDCLSLDEEICTSELYSRIPSSCPLLCNGEITSEGGMRFQNSCNCGGSELSPDASEESSIFGKTPLVQSEGKYAKGVRLENHRGSTVTEGSKSLDRETFAPAASTTGKESPSRRFNFGLSRLGRSLSYKESSAASHFSSSFVPVKSGPLSSGASCIDDTSTEKENVTSRGRSSPLRRLLSPLLKPKAANSLHHEDGAKPLKVKHRSLSFIPTFPNESILNEQHQDTMIRALLKFSIKNGLPLFKFVVDSSSNILVATMDNLMTSEKDNSCTNYTIFSVNEIKKRGGSWIKTGKKNKQNYVYNTTGQMKISRSCSQNMTDGSCDQFIMMESTLFGVYSKQPDHEKTMPKRELAALVLKIPCQYSEVCNPGSKDVELSKRSTECVLDGRPFCQLAQTKNSFIATLILSDGVHGFPRDGAPSPLLHRWKTGGTCDCGGWDLGCKFRVLTNQDQCSEVLENSEAFPVHDEIELFAQGSQRNGPLFCLSPFKEDIYSVDFKSSVSLLQAFFTCITVLNCQKSAFLFEMNNAPESTRRDGSVRKSTSARENVPTKFASCPPLSPVGRV